MSKLIIRRAESDEDVVAIHRFLIVLAMPTLPGELDAQKSATEVWRVVKQDIGAFMALRDDRLLGTIGLVMMEHWWGKDVFFLGNR